MISVKDAMSELDQRLRFTRKCLQLWQGSLRAVEIYVFPLFPDAAKKAEEDWRQVHKCLEEDTPEDVLASTPRLVERVLFNYAQDARRAQQEHLDSVRAILEAMASAAKSVRSRTTRYSATFEGVSETLGRLVQLENPEEMRRQLRHEAQNLRDSVSQLVEENEASLRAMETDLQHFQQRLADAEAEASTDPLTGVANRRELERQMDLRIRQRTPFCALLFDLDDFKSINDRFGHECGDQVLRGFADILIEQVRPGDVVARWGGDEYFVIMDCAMKDALRRSQQIAERLARRYTIQSSGRKWEIPVQASTGLVEHIAGETTVQLFRRADQAMYAAKATHARNRPD